MAIELIYAGQVFALPDGDPADTMAAIEGAIAAGRHDWLDVLSADGPTHILIGPGIPIAVRQSETKWARRHW